MFSSFGVMLFNSETFILACNGSRKNGPRTLVPLRRLKIQSALGHQRTKDDLPL